MTGLKKGAVLTLFMGLLPKASGLPSAPYLAMPLPLKSLVHSVPRIGFLWLPWAGVMGWLRTLARFTSHQPQPWLEKWGLVGSSLLLAFMMLPCTYKLILLSRSTTSGANRAL